MSYVIDHIITEGEGVTRRVNAYFDTLAQAVNWVRANIIVDLVGWYSEQASKAGWGMSNDNAFQHQVDERSFHAALEWIEEV